MKVADYYWDHPLLKPFARSVPEGAFLFHQGEPGNTMFIIVRGIVELISERDGKNYVLGILEAGQFVGEKAIVEKDSYPRVFSAHAKTDLSVLELSLKDFDIIQEKAPELMNAMLQRIFEIAAQRLDRAKYLERLLRSSDNATRLIHLILYFSRSAGAETAQGRQVLVNTDNIHYYLDIPEEKIDACLKELEKEKLLSRESSVYITFQDENALIEAIPIMRAFL